MPMQLNERQSRARRRELNAAGYETRRVRLEDGSSAILKRKKTDWPMVAFVAAVGYVAFRAFTGPSSPAPSSTPAR